VFLLIIFVGYHGFTDSDKVVIEQSAVNKQKSKAAQIYKGTYEGILKKIVSGKLIHADETRINIKGKDAYVWVFTNLEEVAYYYTETREGDFLQELLREFHGVLVSDFYAAYDSMTCPQQKLLLRTSHRVISRIEVGD